jgi:hypothetical protein
MIAFRVESDQSTPFSQVLPFIFSLLFALFSLLFGHHLLSYVPMSKFSLVNARVHRYVSFGADILLHLYATTDNHDLEVATAATYSLLPSLLSIIQHSCSQLLTRHQLIMNVR